MALYIQEPSFTKNIGVDTTGLPGIGRNEWLKYHFARKPMRTEDTMKSNLEVIYTEKAKRIVSFDQARREVAQEIYETKPKDRPLYVAMSGGCDSELVAKTFLELGIPFTPVIVDSWYFAVHMNYADTWWAYRWCKKNNIEPWSIRMDTTETFFANMAIVEKVKARKTWSIINAHISDLVKQKDNGILINGQAFPEYYPDHTMDYIKGSTFYDEFSKFNRVGWIMHECDFYVNMNDRSNTFYNFLSWTPEIVLAYYMERDMNAPSEDNKHRIMNLEPRPKMASPDLPYFNVFGEAQRKLRLERGTSEVTWLGTHEQMYQALYDPN